MFNWTVNDTGRYIITIQVYNESCTRIICPQRTKQLGSRDPGKEVTCTLILESSRNNPTLGWISFVWKEASGEWKETKFLTLGCTVYKSMRWVVVFAKFSSHLGHKTCMFEDIIRAEEVELGRCSHHHLQLKFFSLPALQMLINLTPDNCVIYLESRHGHKLHFRDTTFLTSSCGRDNGLHIKRIDFHTLPNTHNGCHRLQWKSKAMQ